MSDLDEFSLLAREEGLRIVITESNNEWDTRFGVRLVADSGQIVFAMNAWTRPQAHAFALGLLQYMPSVEVIAPAEVAP